MCRRTLSPGTAPLGLMTSARVTRRLRTRGSWSLAGLSRALMFATWTVHHDGPEPLRAQLTSLLDLLDAVRAESELRELAFGLSTVFAGSCTDLVTAARLIS